MGYAIRRNDYDLFQLFMCAATNELKTQIALIGGFRPLIRGAMKSKGDRSDEMLEGLLSLCYSDSGARLISISGPVDMLYQVIEEVDSASKFELVLNWVASKGDSHEQAASSITSPPPDDESTAAKPHSFLTKRLRKGGSFMHEAVVRGRLSIVRFLLHQLRRQDAVRVNDVGNTPLHAIARGGNNSKEIAELLVNANSTSANMKNEDDCLPIHLACECKQDGIVSLLTGHTDNLNSENSAGNTPLLCGVLNQSTRVVEVLLKTQRVDVLKKNRHAQTAFGLALQQDDARMLRLLHSYYHLGI
ncbi:hypothetical protein ACHAPT_005336 [Fusarium lateritium]